MKEPQTTVVEETWMPGDAAIEDWIKLWVRVAQKRAEGYRVTAIGVRFERPVAALPRIPGVFTRSRKR